MLTLTGSNSASALASTPARYIIGDERDRWATSAGTEGDPWALAEARQATFYNAKAVEVSTPTIKGNSNIETSFYQGTQERWCHRCPECGEYSEIVFDNIHFDPEVKRIRGKKSWSLKSGVSWSCPACGCLIPEDTMRKQPAKWIADNPDAYKKGVRSFWLNAFSSPWTPWEKIVLKFLDAKDDPQRLKVVYNTLLGQLWEDRGDLEDEDTMLARREDYVAGHLDKVNWKAVAVGAAVGGIAVATGKAVVEAGKYLAELGDDYNKAMNQLSASTGATGDELDALGESVKNIYAQNLGEDFNDVAEGLAATQKASDLAGEALEQATAAGFVLRDTFDYDISESARAASALMKNFNISAEEAYGLIATGAQNGADKNGDLLDTLNEYSAQFAALGLSADQFMGSLVEGADAGLFSIDKVADAVKEFNIRAKDGSDSSAEAFKGLGLNSDKMFAAFAAGGETAQAAFFDTVEALNKLEDPLKRNEIGVALFGSQFEDLEAGILPVLGDIETAAYDGAAALQQINDVKYNDLGSAFEAVKRSAEVALLPMASMIANTLTSLAPILTDTFEEISPVITDTLNACMPFVQDFLVGMGDTLKKVMPMVTELAAGILPLLAQLVGSFLPPLLDLAQQLLPPLMQIVQAILPPIASILATVLPMLTQIISTVLPVLANLIAALLPVITPLLEDRPRRGDGPGRAAHP